MQLQTRTRLCLRRNPRIYAIFERRRSRAGVRIGNPYKPQGEWSLDLGINGRSGAASNLEAELTYGLTPDIKLAVSGPVVFQPDPYPRSSVTMNTPISGDFGGLA